MTQSIVFEYRPAAFEALQAAMLTAFETGAERVVLDLDELPRLDTDGVRGLITLLRRSREVGGEVALRATRPEVLRTLNTLALDRLFPMVSAA
ncbi:MAG TPA: STAS domain-containing protein [Candidatus Aquilonibacter sp.]|nr:STAS domain-containing protein [Candidatus Aquilonibacter sp.]